MANKSVEATYKSQDTEEWQDKVFTRPLGLLLARAYGHFGIHPNVVTVWGIVWGAVSGILMYWRTWPCTLAAIALLVWANLHDSADGQLARMTGKKTQLGRILDGFASDVWFLSIYVTIALRLTVQSGWGVWSWLLCSLAGFICHARQAQMSDYYRNIHLYYAVGQGRSELEDTGVLARRYEAMPWQGHWVEKTFLFFYMRYTERQEALTPEFQRFREDVRIMYGRDLPQRLRDDFRRGSLPLMKWTNILTHNTRANVLFLSLLASLVTGPDLVWVYPVFEITVMSVIGYHMCWSHERLCRRMSEKVREARYD